MLKKPETNEGLINQKAKQNSGWNKSKIEARPTFKIQKA